MTTARSSDHPTSAASSRGKGAVRSSFRLPVDRPVQRPKPVNTSSPIPLDSSAGSMIANSCGPPTPATSIRSTAPTRGLPKIAEMAAAAPAAPRMIVLCGVAGAWARSLNSSASPPPRAISGASGPRVAPSGRLHSAARMTPGRAIEVAPAACSPDAGMWPPAPGRRVTTSPTRTPATSSSGSGHHQGGPLQPSASGRSAHTRCSSWWSETRNQNAASETGMPIRAQRTSSFR